MKILGLINLINRLFGVTKGEIVMAKADVVSAGVAAIQAGEVQVYSDQLGLAYDGGFSEGAASVPVGSGGGFSQADIDAAVQAKADADAQADAQRKADFDALVAKESLEADLIGKLKSLLFPAA